MPLTDWSNGITDTSGGHDLRLPFDEYLGQFQLRHYFFLQIPVSAGLNATNVTRGFKFQLYENAGQDMVMELDYELTLNITSMAVGSFGLPVLSLLSYAVTRERFRTSMINQEATDEIQVINSQTTSGRIQRYDGTDLTDEEVAALENPSFIHTLGKQRTSEFGTVILDTDRGLGTDTAYLEGRVELPVYRQNVGPDTQLDIVFDSMSGAGRADRYQFRAGGLTDTPDMSAIPDIFDGVAVASLAGIKGAVVLYQPAPGAYDTRATMLGINNPSIMCNKHDIYTVIGLDKASKTLDEYQSRNGGRSFVKVRNIYKGLVKMPQAVTINEETGETGVATFEGTDLVFRKSGDAWASRQLVASFNKPEPMALSVSKTGLLRLQNGKGVTFENRRGGVGPWDNKSTVALP